MPRFADRLRDNLPTLYRPDIKDDTLLQDWLTSLGAVLDAGSGQLFHVMQSHWSRFADSAIFDAHHHIDRQRRGLPPTNVRDVQDMAEVMRYPHIHDLARIAGLVGIPPWIEPPTQRELVEGYRRRLGKYMALYRQGLGTVNALRLITEAESPLALDLPLPQRQRCFAIEEGVPFNNHSHAVVMQGIPAEMVGPMMRWTLTHTGSDPVTPSVFVEGVEAVADEIDPTLDPLIEHYQPGSDLVGLGLAYRGTLAPGQGLRIEPARISWLAIANTLRSSPEPLSDNVAADPSANGPWTEVSGMPVISVQRCCQTGDRVLWLAGAAAGANQIWRYDGANWLNALDGVAISQVHAMFQHRNELLLGTDDGLFRMYLYPGPGDDFALIPVAALAGNPVRAIIERRAGGVWLGTADGVKQYAIDDDGADLPVSELIGGTDVHALLERGDELLIGGEHGILRQRYLTGVWHYFNGSDESEQVLDWQPFDPGVLPSDDDIFLPLVTSLAETPDQSLWIGSAQGLARHYARHERDLLYKTVLEAFPDLMGNAIHVLHVDGRGMLWIGGDDGLFRYDGRDIAQYDGGESRWLSHGRCDALYPDELQPSARGVWQFDRALGQWLSYHYDTASWLPYADDRRTLTGQDAVRDVLLTPSIVAHTGQWVGDAFQADAAVPLTDFEVRCKPQETRVASGGLPALPEMPSGDSVWRYLQVEPPGMTIPVDLPWWSPEGRLVPPPDQPAAWPGRYRSPGDSMLIDGTLDFAMFAYCPAARVRMHWADGQTVSVLVRLFRRRADESMDPAIIDRIWQGLERVRPAAVGVRLAVEGEIVRGER